MLQSVNKTDSDISDRATVTREPYYTYYILLKYKALAELLE